MCVPTPLVCKITKVLPAAAAKNPPPDAHPVTISGTPPAPTAIHTRCSLPRRTPGANRDAHPLPVAQSHPRRQPRRTPAARCPVAPRRQPRRTPDAHWPAHLRRQPRYTPDAITRQPADRRPSNSPRCHHPAPADRCHHPFTLPSCSPLMMNRWNSRNTAIGGIMTMDRIANRMFRSSCRAPMTYL